MGKALAEDTTKVADIRGQHVSENLRKQLAKGNACYVLITCANPSKEGKMEVAMSYEGDADLAAMLIETAQEYLHEDAL